MNVMAQQELTLTRTFDAPRELVWRAYTEPEQIARWWGPAGITTPLETITVELRPGGAYRLTMVDGDGNEYPADMTIRELVAPERLVVGWDAQGGLGAGEVTIVLTELPGHRTRLESRFVGEGTPKSMQMMEQGTKEQLDKLAALLAG